MQAPARIDHWIDGSSRPARDGRVMDVVDPATGKRVCSMAAAGAADVADAQAAAARALPATMRLWAS